MKHDILDPKIRNFIAAKYVFPEFMYWMETFSGKDPWRMKLDFLIYVHRTSYLV